MSKVAKFFSRFSVRDREQKKSEKYLDSQEFLDDVHKAVKAGAEDQARYMKSVGMSWD